MSQIAIYLLCIKDNFSVLIRHLGRVGMVYIVSISKGSSSQHTPARVHTGHLTGVTSPVGTADRWFQENSPF